MKTLVSKTFRPTLMAAIACLFFAVPQTRAQTPARPAWGNMADMSPEQMQKQIQQFALGAIRDRLGVTDEADWAKIEGKMGKVFQLRMEMTLDSFGGMLRQGPGGGRFGALAPASAETEAVQQAVDANAKAAEIRAKLAQLRQARERKEAEFAKAQAELKKVLTLEQEATLVLAGLLD